jgi:hypothetical protein
VTSPYDQLRPEQDVYIAELKQLLAAGGLKPDTRARCLATLIDATVLPDAAEKIAKAVRSLIGDAIPMMTSEFGE